MVEPSVVLTVPVTEALTDVFMSPINATPIEALTVADADQVKLLVRSTLQVMLWVEPVVLRRPSVQSTFERRLRRADQLIAGS